MTDYDDEGGPIIHSWLDVFTNKWKIHSFMGWRPNIPGGVDGVLLAYFMVAAIVVTALDYVPGVSSLLGVVPWLPRHVVIPAYFAWIMTMATPDDRSSMRYLLSRVRLHLENMQLPELSPTSERIPVLHDETAAGRPQPGHVVGPLHVEFNRPVRIRATGKGFICVPDDDGDTGPVVLGGGVTLTVR